MKTLSYFVLFLLFVSCSTNKQVTMVWTGFDFDLPNRVTVHGPRSHWEMSFYDNLSENIMSEILLKYYRSLSFSKDFYLVEAVLDSNSVYRTELRSDSTILKYKSHPYILFHFSRKAQDGYLHLTRLITNSIQPTTPIEFLINSDTVNNRRMVEKLLLLKKEDIESYSFEDDRYFKILTKRSRRK